MADVQITCVLKTGADHSTITHLGGTGGGGWTWTKKQVVDSIRAGTNTFFTMVGGVRANVHVVEGNPPYVQTVADGKWTNNLLALPPCG